MERIRAVRLQQKTPEGRYTPEQFGVERARKAREFHRSFPEYEETPLVGLKHLAELFRVSGVYIKDESYRFGLNAFKGLGGSFCAGAYIAEKLGWDIGAMTYERMTGDTVRAKLGPLTFVTATDGNHGRGIAWTANRLGMKSVVYMPKGSSEARLEHIRALGAEAAILDLNYDDTVRYAKKKARENGWVLLQDTSWEGYEEIPRWIMQGYTTMALEAAEALERLRVKPTHIFLQAGVGSMAGALTAFFRDFYREMRPVIVIVESDQADCIFRTARANDGKIHAVTGDMRTIMAGLACGEPCTIGWSLLHDYADYFLSLSDAVAAKGMRVLGNPLKGDARVISGESGAAGAGAAAEILMNGDLRWLKEELGLTKESNVLCFSTEGDTDPENYRKIVWDGAYSGGGSQGKE